MPILRPRHGPGTSVARSRSAPLPPPDPGPRGRGPVSRCHAKRLAARVAAAGIRATTGEPDLRVGIIASLQTHGSPANWRPHLHLLVTDGGFRPDGTFVRWPGWPACDGPALGDAFRRAALRLFLWHPRVPRSMLVPFMDHRSAADVSRAALIAALGVVASVRLADAQCPDGTPPPCAAPRRPASAPAPNSVAVLFFQSLSRDTADVFLADGLTDELITRLSQVRRLEVKSRFASDRVRGRRAADPRALGRTLGAVYLVRGSLQQAGGRVRVNVALVRAQSGRQVWGEVYERAGDIFAIQADIARAVAEAITGRLLPHERAALARVPTRDPVAYDLYLRGVGASYAFSEPGMRAGLDFFDQAIGRDPAFAAAHLQIAATWVNLADGYVEGRVGYARAREAAERALRLDSTLAAAYAVRAVAAIALDADAPQGRRLAERALELDPASAWGHYALMNALYLSRGAEDSILAEARRAWQADTLDEGFAAQYLKNLLAMRRIDAVAALLPRMEGAIAPADARVIDGAVRLGRGDAAAAAERLSWAWYGGVLAAEYVRAQLALGRRDAARAAVDSMVQASQRGYFNAFGLARACAALGDVDCAFAWLDRAWAQRTVWLAGLRTWADFAPLHGNPRWAELLRRMGLEP